MKKTKIGKTDIEVSNIGLGAINFGTKIDKECSFALLDTYVSMGGNFIDTANNYAVWNGGNGGESEQVIGEWHTKRKNRHSIIIGTKIGALPKDNGSKNFSNMQGLKRETILNAVDQSLSNLQTSYIDILYLHVDDFSVPQYEVLKTLHELVLQKKIKAIACSNFYAWRIESARQICLANNFTFFSAVQQRYSYLQPQIEADFSPQIALNQDLHAYLKHYQDITLIAYSPLLHGQYTTLDHIIDEKYDTKNNQEKLLDLKSQDNAIHTVLNHITDSYHGSVALLTTSKIQHLTEIMKLYQ